LIDPWEPRFGFPNELDLHKELPKLSATAELTHRPSLPVRGEIEVYGCDFSAEYTVRVRIEDEPPARLSEFGYLFTVKAGNGRYARVYPIPLKAHIVGDSAEFEIGVGDFAEQRYLPIEVEIEVVAVDRAMRKGKPTTFRLRASAR